MLGSFYQMLKLALLLGKVVRQSMISSLNLEHAFSCYAIMSIFMEHQIELSLYLEWLMI